MTEEQRITPERLEDLLREAEKAHAAYETDLGQRDDNWPAWYAQYIFERLPLSIQYPDRIEDTPDDLPSREPYVSG